MKNQGIKIFLVMTAAVGVIASFIGRTSSRAVTQEISISADKNSGPVKILTGLLHGITYDQTKDYATTVELISRLKPQVWRLANFPNNVYGFVVGAGQFPQKQGTKIKFVVQDAFFNKYGTAIVRNRNCHLGKADCALPFDDLKKLWETFLEDGMRQMMNNNIIIDEYDIFAEPNWATQDQLFELFKVAHDIIRRYKPAARIEGLENASYDEDLFKAFLIYVANNKLRLDALSWNEFKNPELVVGHVNEMRRFIAEKPGLCSPECPQIYIDEYLGPQAHLVPGWNVGWLYYLHEARVDQIQKACWNVRSRKFPFRNWSTCWNGFDGMLLEDNTTPQNIYWVYKAYADMEGGAWLHVEGGSGRTVALASRNDLEKEIRILVGRYDGHWGPVTVRVKDYPYGSGEAEVRIFKIPDNDNAATALDSPVSLPVQYIAAENGVLKIMLEDFHDGEAYAIVLRSPGTYRDLN